ncbi:MAG TPA: site-2 protease family protein [Gammaproteobacteria bacterium]|nr:site-2 protease family protein [Gammaproteobacteria bacterium]
MPEFSLVQKIILIAPPVLFAIVFHEVAHGWVANKLGDPTARMLGRLTLNPIKHVDPIGTILIPAALILLHSPFLFGWAKPVPITPQNFAKPRTGMAWVAAAGPASNLLMALVWVAIAWVAAAFSPQLPWITPFYYMGQFGVVANVVLGVLNLFPLPPLDGSRVLTGILPPEGARVMYRIEPYGLFIVFALMATGILGMLLWPIMNVLINLLLAPLPALP